MGCAGRCVNGVCVPLDTLSYSCQCRDGYRGALCNQPGELASPCHGLACLHGHCQVSDRGEASCDCDDGFTGDLCDQGQHPRASPLLCTWTAQHGARG